MKQCTKCRETKEITDFYKAAHGYRARCKSCLTEQERLKYHTDPDHKDSKCDKVRQKWQENPELWSKRKLAVRKSHLKRHYGMTIADWNVMLEGQNSCCQICKTHIDSCPHKQLMVDHCHATGKVRALLCDFCNTALGKFKDSPQLLREAADYLERHSG